MEQGNNYLELIKPNLFFELEDTVEQAYEFSNSLVALHSTSCPTSDSLNEDSAAVIPGPKDQIVLVVADGAGGHSSGEKASTIAVECITKRIKSFDDNTTSLRTPIVSGIEDANNKILEMGFGGLTTVAVVEIHDHIARAYHVGDSAIYILGNRGKLKFQTVSHSPVGYAIESGLLSEKEALTHKERHVVSNFIGTKDMRIEIGPEIKLAKRDTIIICSDGLSDNLSNIEINDFARKGPIKKAVQKLSKKALERMLNSSNGHPSKPDDLTLILCRPRA